ncbi:vacuolar membrane protein-domain-containing protein [Epithele typhae]|uniref:vacuolar membrane protein-domain-containing protein n=1 Tax=Epithele typhae TaxID=378194 RepID=UPI0020076914|nr:vacuolar membrane protein-domain-containing protein [Epithele typhae]KAH9943145.1 vacuolar membrane protein-domain-containing protein [Epithele typhae]
MPPLEGIDEFLDELPNVDKRSCRLLGPTALIVQALMGVLVILSLVYKRHRETPKRPWRIWLFDVSKQIVGQMFVHGVNVLISDVVAHLSTANACVLYFLNILIDTTFGVGIIYVLLQAMTHVLTVKLHFKGFESGVYGTPPAISYWFRQTAVYVLALTTMKLVVVSLFAVLPAIFDFGEWLLGFLGTSDAAQVIFTMGLFPIMMNILQFWLIDSIVKGSTYSPLALGSDTPRASMDPANEPLFRTSDDEDDDDDDDDGLPARHDIENPAPRSGSISRDRERQSSVSEPKSTGTTTAVPSGSTTPQPKPIDTGVSVHAYPPSVIAASPSSASSSLSSNSSLSKSRRREPPPPLALKADPPSYMNIEVSRSAPPEEVELSRDEDEKWAAWGDEEDWAERVGEEEWTGRRIEARKEAMDDVWRDHRSPNAHAVSVP